MPCRHGPPTSQRVSHVDARTMEDVEVAVCPRWLSDRLLRGWNLWGCSRAARNVWRVEMGRGGKERLETDVREINIHHHYY